MSMLAERKRKQKYSLNPRGKLWSDDSNKFGQKMLEKMGWSQGKGLGLKENGITEGIKVSYKNDSKGMGFKDRNDQWTEHEDKFSKLLENLNGSETDKNSNELKVHSLEKMSRSSRARVHYHKFTRGKDLSRYSEKDLANIFGKKSLKDEVNKPEENGSESDKSEGNAKNSWSTNSGSMYDYFKKKLPNFGKNNDYSIGRNGVLQKKEESESENESRVGFGFGLGYSNQNEGENSENNEEMEKKSSFVSYINSDSSCDTLDNEKRKNRKDHRKESSNSAEFLEKSSKKKKKKDRTHGDALNEPEGIANNAFDPLFNEIQVNKHSLNPIEEESNDNIEDYEEIIEIESIHSEDDREIEKINQKKKKKDKRTKIKENHDMESEKNENAEEVLSKSKKKSKKKFISEGYSNTVCEVNFSEPAIEKSEKKKRKSKSCEIINEIIVEAKNSETVEESNRKRKFNGIDNLSFVAQSTEEVSPKKKKKKSGLENPSFNHDGSKTGSDLEIIENPYEVKSGTDKKRKKSKNLALDNPSFENMDDSREYEETKQNEENSYEIKLKKKKKNKNLALENPSFKDSEPQENPYEVKVDKMKKKKKSKTTLDNPAFSDSPDINESNNDYEIKRKHKNKKKDKSEVFAIDNPALNASDSMNGFQESEVQCDLLMNVVSTPVINKNPESTNNTPNSCLSSSTRLHSAIKRRKSVRFSDVTQERIIPNNVDLQDIENRNELYNINSEVISKSLEDEKMRSSQSLNNFDMSSIDKVSFYETKGLDNKAFDKRKNEIEENVASMAKTIEKYQVEVENDMNEAKAAAFALSIGEVGNPDGENEKLPNGEAKLKFKYANFGVVPHYMQNTVGAKKSYKHLIKGDIVLGFKNTNLHAIKGYANTGYAN